MAAGPCSSQTEAGHWGPSHPLPTHPTLTTHTPPPTRSTVGSRMYLPRKQQEDQVRVGCAIRRRGVAAGAEEEVRAELKRTGNGRSSTPPPNIQTKEICLFA